MHGEAKVLKKKLVVIWFQLNIEILVTTVIKYDKSTINLGRSVTQF